MDIKTDDIKMLREMSIWKNTQPEEYKQFIQDIKSIMSDLIKVAKEISEEFE